MNNVLNSVVKYEAYIYLAIGAAFSGSDEYTWIMLDNVGTKDKWYHKSHYDVSFISPSFGVKVATLSDIDTILLYHDISVEIKSIDL